MSYSFKSSRVPTRQPLPSCARRFSEVPLPKERALMPSRVYVV